MTTPKVYVGIDVAQEHLDVAIQPSGEEWRQEHTLDGIGRLVWKLQSHGVHLVVVESTGGLETALVGELAGCGAESAGGTVRWHTPEAEPAGRPR